MTAVEYYNNWLTNNYDQFKQQMIAYANNKYMQFDEDVFHETLLKIIKKIEKNGLKQMDDKGCANYTFKAFKLNLLREKEYARNKKRDWNITDINGAYEDYLQHKLTHKAEHDAQEDFAVIYCITKANEHFDNHTMRLFAMKYLIPCTYPQLKRITGEKYIRERLIEVREWMKNNITEEEIKQAFQEYINEQ